ncbi:MAG: hypothetical protein K2M87_03650 [Muribaculaceae bacterium]|nr:hypothetical protein [Muribaculaceae bacterium]
MVKINFKRIAFTTGVCTFLALLSALPCSAADNQDNVKSEIRGNQVHFKIAKQGSPTDSLEQVSLKESLFPKASRSLADSHFTWGAEVGSSLDLTSHDLTTIDIDAFLGYKSKLIKLIGIGAGIHRSIHTGNNFIPVYLSFRSSFRSKPSPCFLSVKAGYSFNRVYGAKKSDGDVTASLGLGINLQQSRIAQSYVIISGTYQYFNRGLVSTTDLNRRYIFFATLAIGVNF